MSRVKLNYPETQDSWNQLPQEFKDYLDILDEVRLSEVKKQVIDPLYPSYDYEWELDEEIPLRTVLEYWNRDDELPEPIVILDEIQDCIAETSYDAYISSFYSYQSICNNNFTEGLEVYYKGYFGTVRFVCEDYITVCVRKFEGEKSRDVCLIVYPQNYSSIELAKASTK